ncbi:hypothetical protein CISG_04260 [Coccidioides immitis RMSCC 3703]|uniref:Uncharacterized protein n=1 Tax=Coccidioides immitis RMSCC 3703 TaxID=454286 RepID=A0A0J8QTF7_COCIT|nr:hypothetical protein CISG_04260 [Coccidioides immitis RMSCC 3703]
MGGQRGSSEIRLSRVAIVAIKHICVGENMRPVCGKLSAVENVHNRQIMLSITTPTPQTPPIDSSALPTHRLHAPRSPRKLNRYTTPPYPSTKLGQTILRATPPGFTSRSVASQGHEESKSCGTRTGRPEGVDVKKRTQQRSRRASGEFGGLALVCQDRYIGSLGCVVHAQDCLYLPDKKTEELHGIAPLVYLTSTRVIVKASSLAVKFENGGSKVNTLGKITAHPEFDVKSKLELRLKRMSTSTGSYHRARFLSNHRIVVLFLLFKNISGLNYASREAFGILSMCIGGCAATLCDIIIQEARQSSKASGDETNKIQTTSNIVFKTKGPSGCNSQLVHPPEFPTPVEEPGTPRVLGKESRSSTFAR